MSVLMRTISAFPSGRTTGELFALLDVDFNPRKRAEMYAELSTLSEAGKISKGRDGKWRSTAAFAIPLTGAPDSAKSPENSSALLRAAVALFREADPTAVGIGDEPSETGFEPTAMIRYYRSTLRADPRGAIAQVDDRHGVQWQLVTGSGPLTPSDGRLLRISVALDNLSDEFRKALLKREANEQALALGWPIAVGRKQGAPVVWPVGLISAEWQRTDTNLEIEVDSDDILVNPEWLRGGARATGWTASSLQEVFVQTEGLGLGRDDFLSRLREAAAGTIHGGLNGSRMFTELDPASPGIYDIAGLFLPTDSTFTTGAVRDLDQIGAWSKERIACTALAPLLGLRSELPTPSAAVLNAGPVNKEQIAAVRHAMSSQLTVITGPPGTGKSQAIVSIAASVLNDGGSVLVASKNHQALDAVEDRLAEIAPDLPFVVRTLDPSREIDQSFEEVLGSLVREPGRGKAEPDRVQRSRLATMAQERIRALDIVDEQARLNTLIAELLERIDARTATGETASQPIAVRKAGFWKKIITLFLMLLGQGRLPDKATFDPEGASLDDLRLQLERYRAELARTASVGDPIRLTREIAELVRRHLPRLLAARVSLSDEEIARLGEEHANLQLSREKGPLPPALAADVVAHRPLWLASVLGAPRRVPLNDGLFDLVIFDEASQCDIASALPLFARAKRAVVVGDDRQLSFISQLGIAHDRNLMQAQGLPVQSMGRFAQSRRSLFDLANLTPGASKVMLRDQYRSAPDIVDYINEQFYGGRLRAAGDATRLKPPRATKPGIVWTDIVAPSLPMQGNVNHAEVDAVVAHLRHLLEDERYTGSVGVIAPFRPQVHALSQAVEAALPADLLERAEFRAGTVDSFQGQERDLILFSPCLGYSSATSAVTFVQKDWRRLNVAISRARAVAHVFGDLAYARSGKVSSLQRLAAFATEPRPRIAEGTFDSEWERIVFRRLREKGFDPIPQFEVAGRRLDFALFGAGDIKLDLEIDGRLWHSDADGKRKLGDLWRDHQLMSIGWRVRRFWVDELARDLEGCIERVRQDLS